IQSWLTSSLTSKDRLDTTNIERFWHLCEALPDTAFLTSHDKRDNTLHLIHNADITNKHFGAFLAAYLDKHGQTKDSAFVHPLIVNGAALSISKSKLNLISPQNKLDTTPLYWQS